MKKTLLFAIVLILGEASIGQVLFSEDFEGTMDPGTNIPVGWTETGLSNDGIWSTGVLGFYAATSNGANYAYSQDGLSCGCDKSEDRLILPIQNFEGYDFVTISMDYLTYNSTDELSIELSTNGTFWFNYLTLPASPPNGWVNDFTFSISGSTPVYIAIRYHGGGGDFSSFGVAVDDIRIEVGTGDLEVFNIVQEYSQIPLSQATSIPLVANVRNNSDYIVNTAALTCNVYLQPNLTTPVYSSKSSSVLLAGSGGNQDLTAGNFTPSIAGDYVFEYIADTDTLMNDTVSGNDTLITELKITTDYYARDYGTPTPGGGQGGGASINVIYGNLYDVVFSEQISTVYFALTLTNPSNNLGDTVRAVVYDVVAGVPTNRIGQSLPYVLGTSPSYSAGINEIVVQMENMSGGALIAPVGQIYVGVEEYASSENMQLAHASNYYTPTTTWTYAFGTFLDMQAVLPGFQESFLVRPGFGTTVSIDENIVNSDPLKVFPNPTTGIFTINLGNNANTINYSISSIEGRIIEQGKTSQNIITIDLNDQSKGIYFLRLNDGNDSQVFKIMKQ